MTDKQELGPNQKAWVAALRSGWYQQGEGKLLDENGCYCCLGVAASLYHPKDQIRGEDTLSSIFDVAEALALYDDIGGFILANTPAGRGFLKTADRSLAEANDNGATFEEIADFMEAHPHAVFREAK